MRTLASLIAPSLLAIAAALPGAAQAQIQTQSAGGLELFDNANFQGPSVSIDRQIANLGPGAFDNLATSIRVTGGGAWEMCDGANFTGQCQVITQDVWDLQQLGLNNRISSVRPAQYRPAQNAPIQTQPYPPQQYPPQQFPAQQPPIQQYPGAGPALPGVQPQFQQAPMLVLYENTNFRGRSATYYQQADNLRFEGFDDAARSVDVTGQWTLCEGPNLTGRCEIIGSDVTDLSRLAMSRTVSSVAPVPGGPIYNPNPVPPQQGDRVLAGTNAAFFPAPYIPANRLNSCLRGSAIACEQEVDNYCRSQAGGWREGAYYSIDIRTNSLTDVLCVR